MPYKRRARAPVRRRRNLVGTRTTKRKAYVKRVGHRKRIGMKSTMRKKSAYPRVHHLDLAKSFGNRIKIKTHGRATIDIITDASVQTDCNVVAQSTFSAPTAQMVHIGTWPTNQGAIVNDLRDHILDTYNSQLDTRAGMLPVIINSFARLRVTGFKVRLRFEPTLNSFASNNLAMFVGINSVAQVNAAQTFSGHFFDYLSAMPRGLFRIRSMPSGIVAGAATQGPITLSKYFSLSKLDPKYRYDPEAFGQVITGQQGSVGSVTMNGPSSPLGYLAYGLCSKDGGVFALSQTLGRLTVAITTYVEFWEPIIFPNYGSPSAVHVDAESDDESSEEETPTPKVTKIKKRRSVKVTVKQ